MSTIECIGDKSGDPVWQKGKICKKRLRTTDLGHVQDSAVLDLTLATLALVRWDLWRRRAVATSWNANKLNYCIAHKV